MIEHYFIVLLGLWEHIINLVPLILLSYMLIQTLLDLGKVVLEMPKWARKFAENFKIMNNLYTRHMTVITALNCYDICDFVTINISIKD